MFVIVVIFFFSIISFGISFVATCAYFLLLVVHLQEFSLISSLLSGHLRQKYVFPCLLLPFSRLATLSTFLSATMFQHSNQLDFLLYSFQNTYIFFELGKSIQNIPDTSPWQWGSTSLRRGVEGNNHFCDLLLSAVLVLYWRKCSHCAAWWWW